VSIDAPARSGHSGDETLARLLASIDDAGEAALGRLRGRPWFDMAAAVVSNLADYGYVWVALALWKARRPGPPRRRAVLALAGAGVASYGVNKVAKHLVGRGRPAAAVANSRMAVRRPTSSSFPSGHTLAAFCTAMVLTEGAAQTASALGFAGAVAASRVHLGAHHASDVVGGAVIGTATGLVVRRLLARTVLQPGRPTE
jgi:membrane-associated phospholipid phosphatase